MFTKLIAGLKAASASPGLIDNLAARQRESQGELAMVRAQLADLSERLLLLQGRAASRALPRRHRIRDLSEVEFRVFSQWGEDGIVEWLLVDVAGSPGRCVALGGGAF